MVSETGIDLVSDFLIGPGRHTRLFDQPLDFAVEFFDRHIALNQISPLIHQQVHGQGRDS